MVGVFNNLAEVSAVIYQEKEGYPVEFIKNFRRIFEDLQTISRMLEKYEGSHQYFDSQKQDIVEQHIFEINKIISFQQTSYQTESISYKPKIPESKEEKSRISYLQNEIMALNHLI